MDDIRRPQHLKRRDYAIPAGRPAHSTEPSAQPRQHQPHQSMPARNTNPVPQPGYNQHPQAPAHNQPVHPHPANHPSPQHSHQPAPAHAPPKVKRFKISGKVLSIFVGVLVATAAIFGAGYLLKGSSDSNGIPASITRQVNYDLYFPSPMPNGYVYMKDTATFQIGQVFYKFSNGNKRVTVNEQPIGDPKPNLAKLPGYTLFQSPVGPAAIGKDLNEPTAVVLTPTTLITMHCIGGVSANDLKSAINSLKNIGQKS